MKSHLFSRPTKVLFIALLALTLSNQLNAQRSYPPEIDSDMTIVYKTSEDVDLKLWIFTPPNHKTHSKAPAIVFFFGGGWNAGSPEQFVHHCEYLAARGMLAAVADYRVKTRNNVKANVCVSDAKSAVRYLREHAGELGVDPDRIAAGGGSDGGHLAAATSTLTLFDEQNENLSISSIPNAALLFNPVLVLAPIGIETSTELEKFKNMPGRLGANPEDMSPYHNITSEIVPTVIFHGTDDKTVPFKSVEAYEKKMLDHGNTCILHTYEGEGHGFFNYGRKDNGTYVSTVALMDQFLVELGWLNALPQPM